MVRRTEGRVIYLTEAAVEIFEAERDRDAQTVAWEKERHDWLQLARLIGVPEDRRRAIAERPIGAQSVKAARTIYLTTVEREVKAARRDKRWEDVARMRRRQAAALFEESGGSIPPDPDVLEMYHEGMEATLRELATLSKEAELVGSTCCRACRADNERVFRIADELRTPRLPHADCPRGLCTCDWWPAVPAPKKARRRPPTSGPAHPPAAMAADEAPEDVGPI